MKKFDLEFMLEDLDRADAGFSVGTISRMILALASAKEIMLNIESGARHDDGFSPRDWLDRYFDKESK